MPEGVADSHAIEIHPRKKWERHRCHSERESEQEIVKVYYSVKFRINFLKNHALAVELVWPFDLNASSAKDIRLLKHLFRLVLEIFQTNWWVILFV